MAKEDPDVICLQETKAFLHQMPPEMRTLATNNICRHAGERPGYAGTAIFAKEEFVNSCSTFDHSKKFHEDGRLTEVEVADKVLLIN